MNGLKKTREEEVSTSVVGHAAGRRLNVRFLPTEGFYISQIARLILFSMLILVNTCILSFFYYYSFFFFLFSYTLSRFLSFYLGFFFFFSV